MLSTWLAIRGGKPREEAKNLAESGKKAKKSKKCLTHFFACR